jgi:conjugative transfer signal peptidase TraF
LFLWPTTAVFLAGEAGIRFNTTASVPIGLYRITSDSNAPVVEVCPPGPLGPLSLQRGYRRFARLEGCTDRGELVLKMIVARSGDLVETSANGMRVNGSWIPNTAPAVHDSAGRTLRPWPFGHYRVQPGTVWVASGYNVKSFDSRYFGPVPISEIKHHLHPLWTSPAWR